MSCDNTPLSFLIIFKYYHWRGLLTVKTTNDSGIIFKGIDIISNHNYSRITMMQIKLNNSEKFQQLISFNYLMCFHMHIKAKHIKS